MPQKNEEHTPLRTATNDLWPILVPSKGRPTCPTSKILSAAGVPHAVVVEPQDNYTYAGQLSTHAELWQLPENNQGIAYVRNWIKDRMTNLGARWYWMLDDDITQTYLAEEIEGLTSRRLVKRDPALVLARAQGVFLSVGQVAQGALEYGQFSWSAKKDHAIGYCDVAVAINTVRSQGARYRAEMNLKEDRDFTLQLLTAGYLTVRASHCAFQAPKNGSNQGGLYDQYRAGLEEQASRRMEAAWPGICKFQPKKDGRPDVKINWRAFKPAR